MSEPAETYPWECGLESKAGWPIVSEFIGDHGTWSLKWCQGPVEITHVIDGSDGETTVSMQWRIN